MTAADVPAEALARYREALAGPLVDLPDDAPLVHGEDFVRRHLPHRPPFVFVDGVVAVGADRLCARFDLARHADVFAGHFPAAPRWPGALQLEAMAQAGLLLALSRGEPRDEVALAVVREARFLREVVPGRPVHLVGAAFEDGLFTVLVGQVLQAGRVASACVLSLV